MPQGKKVAGYQVGKTGSARQRGPAAKAGWSWQLKWVPHSEVRRQGGRGVPTASVLLLNSLCTTRDGRRDSWVVLSALPLVASDPGASLTSKLPFCPWQEGW